jgi:hypothetical protein
MLQQLMWEALSVCGIVLAVCDVGVFFGMLMLCVVACWNFVV